MRDILNTEKIRDIKNVKGENEMSYYVFVDNSNVWIEGKFLSAVKKGMSGNTSDAHLKKISDANWKIDFGKLLECVVDGNLADVKEAVIVGSKPTQKDSLWNAMEKAGFKVETQQRNASNREKKIDTGIVQKINRKLYKESEEGDIFVLVLGDSDYVPVIEDIKLEKRKVRVAFWDNAAGEIIDAADEYLNLNDSFEKITL